MENHSPENERMKRRYLTYLEEAESYSIATTDAVAMALERFEAYTKHRDFKKFHPDQAKAFKQHLSEQYNQRTGERLSKSTAYATLNHLKRFFHWLAREPGYKTRVQHSDANYFSPSKRDARVATARREPRVPTMEQIKHVIATMPCGTDIELRNRAVVDLHPKLSQFS